MSALLMPSLKAGDLMERWLLAEHCGVSGKKHTIMYPSWAGSRRLPAQSSQKKWLGKKLGIKQIPRGGQNTA